MHNFGKKFLLIPIILFLLVLVGIGVYAGTVASATKKITVSNIKVDQAKHINFGETVDFECEIVFDVPDTITNWAKEPALKAKQKKLSLEADTFSPNLLNVEIVKEKGRQLLRVGAIGNGWARYFIKCEDFSKTFEVVAGVLEPESISAVESIFISKGEKANLNAIVGPEHADDRVTYEVEDDFVASVDEAGNVSFISTGMTTVKSKTINGIETSTKIVAAIVAEKIELDTHYLTCSLGTTFKPGYAITPSYITYGSDIVFYSENENVVRYDTAKECFIAVAAGETDVVVAFASKDKLSDRMHVTVSGTSPVTEVKTSPDADKELLPEINEQIICKQDGMTKLSVKTIFQNPQLRNGCEITSATIALNYLGYSVDKVTMADNYLDCKKPYNEVDPNEAYMGDPHATGWYCFPPVIVEAVNEYFADNGFSKHTAVDITGCSVNDMKDLIDEGTPVIFWGTLYFNTPAFSSKFTLPDGTQPYYNLHCLVMTGYDSDYVYIADPLGLGSKVAVDKFTKVFEEMGSRAVKIVEK